MWNAKLEARAEAVTCPFCGLACDDLQLTREAGGAQLRNACDRAEAAYARALEADRGQAMIQGRAVAAGEALHRAAELLAGARAPLFAGLATDVNGMRACLALADHCGASLDHANSDALFRNLLVLQDSGWFTSTLTEVRNRADLVVIAGAEVLSRFPRLAERVLRPPQALFAAPEQRQLVILADRDEALPAALQDLTVTRIPVPTTRLGEFAGLLRARLAGRPVRDDALGADLAAPLAALADKLAAARYSVVCWAAAELDFPHAELTVQSLVELVRDLNARTRSAALPMAGSHADITSSQVCTWQTGLPLRSSLQAGYPVYDPHLNRYADLLARGETDLLLWVSALGDTERPPPPGTACILLAPPGAGGAARAEGYLPVGTPGIDHAGHLYRSDSVCALPLPQLRESTLPPVAGVLGELLQRLRDDQPGSAA